jgi:hypothetical protein
MDKDLSGNEIRPLRKQGVPVVTAFDDIWFKIRQKNGFWYYFFPFKLKSYWYFSHAWVAGPYQYEFAKQLGLK